MIAPAATPAIIAGTLLRASAGFDMASAPTDSAAAMAMPLNGISGMELFLLQMPAQHLFAARCSLLDGVVGIYNHP